MKQCINKLLQSWHRLCITGLQGDAGIHLQAKRKKNNKPHYGHVKNVAYALQLKMLQRGELSYFLSD